MLVKSGTVLPMVKISQSTQDIDCGNMELVVFGNVAQAKAQVCLPSENVLREMTVSKKGKGYAVTGGSVGRKVKWVVR